MSPKIGGSAATLERLRTDARLEVVIANAAMQDARRSAWCREKGVFPSDLQRRRDSDGGACAA